MFLTESYMKKSQKPQILMMFSAGLDSLGALFLLLTEEKYRDYDILVQHICLEDVHQRSKAEMRAFRNVLEVLGSMDSYTKGEETIPVAPFYVMPVIGVNESKFYGRSIDYELVMFYAGRICQNRYADSQWKRIEKVALGIQPTDEGWRNGCGDRAFSVFQALQQPVEHLPFDEDYADKSIELLLPLANSSKKDILTMLPKSIRTKFWSCRSPISHQGHYHPCGVCKTCKEIEPILALIQEETSNSQKEEEKSTDSDEDLAQTVHWQYFL